MGILKNKYDLEYSIMNPFIPYKEKYEWEMDIHKSAPARADVEFPISGWSGELGVNDKIVEKILANANGI